MKIIARMIVQKDGLPTGGRFLQKRWKDLTLVDREKKSNDLDSRFCSYPVTYFQKAF